jgi:hypothetical protein
MRECARDTNETGYKCTSSIKKQVLCKSQTEEFKLSRCRKVLNASRSVLSPALARRRQKQKSNSWIPIRSDQTCRIMKSEEYQPSV